MNEIALVILTSFLSKQRMLNIISLLYLPLLPVPTEPSKAPNGVGVTALDATTFSVTWLPLSREDSKGIVRHYDVMYQWKNISNGKWVHVRRRARMTYLVLRKLQLCTEYRISVRACTKVGCGPFSTTVAKVTAGKSMVDVIHSISFGLGAFKKIFYYCSLIIAEDNI